jgi:hypothetical protein
MLTEMVAQYAFVLETGMGVGEGPFDEVLASGLVEQTYLGASQSPEAANPPVRSN